MSVGAAQGRIEEIWHDDLLRPAGVLHVVAVGRDGVGGLAVIRIGADAPAGETDFFALSVARARADAIVTTGAILRAEPTVVHDPGEDLGEWRRQALAKNEPPTLVVLTRGAGLPKEHPAFAQGPTLVATSIEAVGAVEQDFRSRDVEVVGLVDATTRGLVDELRRRGLSDILLEAGPSTVLPLYDDPLVVDELMLSIYEEGPLAERLVAGVFPDEEQLRERFGPPTSEVSLAEKSGRWCFSRFRRRS